MKKIYTWVLLFLLVQIPFRTIAQCNPAIPGNANVINSNDTVNGGFTPQWVCKNDTLVSQGGIFYVYLEPGAAMVTGGGIDSIYVTNGASLSMNGGIHVILHEPAAILNVAGGIPTYVPCPSITYDYTNAPLNGCLVTSVSEENTNSAPVSVFPNPAKDNFTVTFSNTINKGVIEVYNVLGKKIFTEDVINVSQKEVQLKNSDAGIYFVKVHTEEKTFTEKLVVQ